MMIISRSEPSFNETELNQDVFYLRETNKDVRKLRCLLNSLEEKIIKTREELGFFIKSKDTPLDYSQEIIYRVKDLKYIIEKIEIACSDKFFIKPNIPNFGFEDFFQAFCKENKKEKIKQALYIEKKVDDFIKNKLHEMNIFNKIQKNEEESSCYSESLKILCCNIL